MVLGATLPHESRNNFVIKIDHLPEATDGSGPAFSIILRSLISAQQDLLTFVFSAPDGKGTAGILRCQSPPPSSHRSNFWSADRLMNGRDHGSSQAKSVELLDYVSSDGRSGSIRDLKNSNNRKVRDDQTRAHCSVGSALYQATNIVANEWPSDRDYEPQSKKGRTDDDRNRTRSVFDEGRLDWIGCRIKTPNASFSLRRCSSSKRLMAGYWHVGAGENGTATPQESAEWKYSKAIQCRRFEIRRPDRTPPR